MSYKHPHRKDVCLACNKKHTDEPIKDGEYDWYFCQHHKDVVQKIKDGLGGGDLYTALQKANLLENLGL